METVKGVVNKYCDLVSCHGHHQEDKVDANPVERRAGKSRN